MPTIHEIREIREPGVVNRVHRPAASELRTGTSPHSFSRGSRISWLESLSIRVQLPAPSGLCIGPVGCYKDAAPTELRTGTSPHSFWCGSRISWLESVYIRVHRPAPSGRHLCSTMPRLNTSSSGATYSAPTGLCIGPDGCYQDAAPTELGNRERFRAGSRKSAV